MAARKKSKTPVARKKKSRRILDPDNLQPTQVAQLIEMPYQTARNMMLRRVFGETKYEGSPPRLTVKRTGVDAWLAKRSARAAGK